MITQFWPTRAVLITAWLLAAAVGRAEPAAYPAIVAAYRGNPSPQGLYELSQAARGEGRMLEARDLARRALADPTARFSSEDKAQLETLSALPIAHYGELLVQGQNGAHVSIDGRLRGVLPLFLPLLIDAGRHEVLLELRARRVRTQVEIPEGRLIEMRFASGTDAVAITTPPPLLLLARTSSGAPLPADALSSIDQSLRRNNLARAAIEDPPRKPLGGAGCIRSIKCQLELGAREKVDFVLALRLTQEEGGHSASYELVDVAIGDVASRGEVACTSCTAQSFLTTLSESLNQKLLEGSTRQRGEIDVSSTPSGAVVRRGEVTLGRTPLRRPAWIGSQKLALQLSGYRDKALEIEVRDGQTSTEKVALERDPSSLFGALGRQPRWRLGVGGAAIGVGAFMLSIGIGALVVNGRCVDDPVPPAIRCERAFATLAPGIGLTIVGPLLVAGGTALIAVPAR